MAAGVDRHGHALAQVFAVKGDERVWLQGELAARGLARVYSFPDNHACIKELLARESEARAKHAGVWGVSTYRILAASDLERLGRLTRSYQLVEGVVAAVGDTRAQDLSQFRPGLAPGLHHRRRAQGSGGAEGSRPRRQGPGRQACESAGLDRVAERAHGPPYPCRADRSAAGCAGRARGAGRARRTASRSPSAGRAGWHRPLSARAGSGCSAGGVARAEKA